MSAPRYLLSEPTELLPSPARNSTRRDAWSSSLSAMNASRTDLTVVGSGVGLAEPATLARTAPSTAAPAPARIATPFATSCTCKRA